MLRQGVPVLIPHSADATMDAEYARMGVMFANGAAPMGRLTRGKLDARHVVEAVQPSHRKRLVDATRDTAKYGAPNPKPQTTRYSIPDPQT